MPKAVKINSKRWSTKDGSVKVESRDELSTASSQKNKPTSSVEVLPKQELPEYKDNKLTPNPEVPGPTAEKNKPASVEVTPNSEIPGPKAEKYEKNKPASSAEVTSKSEILESKAEKWEKNKPTCSAEVTPKPEIPESKSEKYKNSKSASCVQVISKPLESKAEKREESLGTKSSVTCDIDPPVEEYFSEDKPRSKRNKSTESSAPVEIKSELTTSTVENKSKSKKKKGSKTENVLEICPTKSETAEPELIPEKPKRNNESSERRSKDETVTYDTVVSTAVELKVKTTELKPGEAAGVKASADESQKNNKKNRKKRGGSQEPESEIAQTDIKLKTKSIEVKSAKLKIADEKEGKNAKGAEAKSDDSDDTSVIPPVVVSKTKIKLKTDNDADTSKGQINAAKVMQPSNPRGKPGVKDSSKLFSKEKTEKIVKSDEVKSPDKKFDEKVEETGPSLETELKAPKLGTENRETGARSKAKEEETGTKTRTEDKESAVQETFEDKKPSVKTKAKEAAATSTAEDKETGATAESEDKGSVAQLNDQVTESMESSQVGWSEMGKRGKGKKKKGKNKGGNNTAPAQSKEESIVQSTEQVKEAAEKKNGAQPKRAVALEKHQERSG